MALLQIQQHPPLLLSLVLMLLSFSVQRADTRSSQISDLKSKISGVEELLEEFRKQLQQDQAYRAGDAAPIDSCAGDFDAAGARIIRARDSIEQGATFLLAPERVFTWRDCLHACCSQPHCTVAVVQEEPRQQPGDGLPCYLFNCTYRGRHVCSFAPQQGFSTYSRTVNSSGQGQGLGQGQGQGQGQGHGLLPAAPSRGSSRRPGEEEEEEEAAQGGR